jgi:hypothetical protein
MPDSEPSNYDQLGAAIKRYQAGGNYRTYAEQRQSLVQKLQSMSNAERIIDVERLSEGFEIKGDFEGCVNGEWVRLDNDGAGIVTYKNKQYKTESIGFVSAPKGLRVQLCYAKAKYYSTF